MAHSTKFPLFKHGRGYWCKTVKGKHRYFGKIADDPSGQKALKKWLAEKDYLLAGVEPPTATSKVTVKALCNHWIHQKKLKVDAGELAERTYNEYFKTCTLLMEYIPASQPALAVGPNDFTKLKSELSRRFNINGTAKRIVQIKSIFITAHEEGLLKQRPNFGKSFRKAPAKAFREHRNAQGDRSYTPKEIKALLAKARVNGKSFILLGLQAGFGATDCAELPQSAVQGDWIVWPRVKTAINRKIPLWPETRKALKASIAYARQRGEHELCFINYAGHRYVSEGERTTKVSKEFATVRKSAKVNSSRMHYDLRRTFATIAGESLDQVAVDAIMGHIPRENDMAARYRQKISDDRLRAVVDHVHTWLYGGEA